MFLDVHYYRKPAERAAKHFITHMISQFHKHRRVDMLIGASLFWKLLYIG